MIFCNSEHLTDLGEKGSAAIRLTNPTSVAFTQSGTMFCFAASGNFLGCINQKKLKSPFSLSVTSNDRLLVCDGGDKSVKVLSPDVTDCDSSPWKAVCIKTCSSCLTSKFVVLKHLIRTGTFSMILAKRMHVKDT